MKMPVATLCKDITAAGLLVLVLTPLFCGAIYLQQNLQGKMTKKVATAAHVETFSAPTEYPKINLVSPFARLPQNRENTPQVPSAQLPDAPPRPQIPGPSTPAVGQAGNAGGGVASSPATPVVRSIVTGAKGNMAIVAYGNSEIVVEAGQETSFGSIDSITTEGVSIDGTLYPVKGEILF